MEGEVIWTQNSSLHTTKPIIITVFLYVYLFIITILTVLQNLCIGFSLLWSNQLSSLTCLKPNLNCFVWLLKINGRTLAWSHACHCLGKDLNFSNHYILQNSILFKTQHTHTHTHKQTQNDMFHAGTLVGPKMPVSAKKKKKKKLLVPLGFSATWWWVCE